ncbi:MAG TPA: terminase small subunit [Feifaniaceae bacterium]|nr:terminase small subunit [Feifaniaceae bacterium]
MEKKESAAEVLRQKAEAYFAACDATRERVTLKNGELSYHQVPYTMAGLCAALDVPREALERARRPQEAGKRGRRSRVRAALAWAAARVEQHLVERALLGEINANLAALLLKDWGYGATEPQKAEKSEGPLTVVLEDPEDFSR